MVAFTVTFMLLRFICMVIYYLIYGICMAVFYIVGFTFMGLRDLYCWIRLRKLRGY